MGYALFTARKLMLQNRLNQMNYRMMVLSQQRNDLVEEAANLEMKNGMQKSMRSIFQNTAAQDLYTKLQTGMKDGKLNLGDIDPNTKQPIIYDMTKSDQSQNAASMVNQKIEGLGILNQVSDSADKSKLQGIQTIENQIDLEMKKLDTQVKETTAEMESVEKAEDQAIKSSAPKYGGGGN